MKEKNNLFYGGHVQHYDKYKKPCFAAILIPITGLISIQKAQNISI